MKKLILILIPTICLFAGCKYDDSGVWEELNAQKARIEALESQAAAQNSNIVSLQSIIDALQKNVYVSSVTATDEGYTITFSDGKTASITNGKDGKTGPAGPDGNTPVIGVRTDENGDFFWTLNGEWLLGEDGDKIPASRTGATPKLKIENGDWMVSYDEGVTWRKVEGQETSAAGVFKSVTTDATSAYFTLADDTVITIPLSSTAKKLQLIFNESVFAKMRDGEVLSTAYRIEAADNAEVSFDTFESDGWTVTIRPADDRSGRISIKAPEDVTTGKIFFVLSDNLGGSFVKLIKIGFNDTEKPAIQTSYSVDYTGGELTLPLMSSTAEVSEEGQDWIEVISTGDEVKLNIKENVDFDVRKASITLEDGTVIELTQHDRAGLVISETDISIPGSLQKVSFIVKSNATVYAKVLEGSDWLSVSPEFRGLEDLEFRFTARRNETGEERVGVVSFSCGDLEELVTITQAVYSGDGMITVSEILASEEGAEVEVFQSKVVARSTKGFLIADYNDNTKMTADAIFVNDGGENVIGIGDNVTMKASTTTMFGLPALSEVTNLTLSSDTYVVKYPEARDITSGISGYNPSVPEYVAVTGGLKINDSEYTLTVGTEKVIIYYPLGDLGLNKLNKWKVAVNGYCIGKDDEGCLIVVATSKKAIEKVTEIADVIALADDATFENLNAVVVASSSKGEILQDATGVIYTYGVTGHNIGDQLTVNGKKTTYGKVNGAGGIPEITGAAATVASTGKTVIHPAATDITDTFDEYTATSSEFIKFTGVLTKSGTNYNIKVDSAKTNIGSIVGPVTANIKFTSDVANVTVDKLSGHNITVTGYFAGISGTVYVNVVAVEIKDNGVPAEPEEDGIVLKFPDDNSANNKTNNYTTSWTAKSGTYSWTIANFNNNNWNWSSIKCGRKSDPSVATITTSVAVSDKIGSVAITFGAVTASSINSSYLEVATDSAFTQNVQKIVFTSKNGKVSIPVTTPAQNCYYRITFDCASNKNGFVEINKIVYVPAE